MTEIKLVLRNSDPRENEVLFFKDKEQLLSFLRDNDNDFIFRSEKIDPVLKYERSNG